MQRSLVTTLSPENSRPHAILVVNPAGYGFAKLVGKQSTVFIPPQRLGGAMDGDEVELDYWSVDKGLEGRIVGIHKRHRTKIVGVLNRVSSRRWRIEPDDPRICFAIRVVGTPDPTGIGLLVAGTIRNYPENRDGHIEVEFDRILGKPGDLNAEIQRILIENQIDSDFPADILKLAEDIPRCLSAADIEGRSDLRKMPFMTIDPVDARDFDDAVVADLRGEDSVFDDIRVHVAVADVSHYVLPGDPIDIQAVDRCFSVYLPDRAIPMLPRQLSSHMCSLVPDEDRLAMVVGFTVGYSGEVRDVEVLQGVIHSHKRLSYEQAAEIMAGKSELDEAVQQRVLLLRRASDRLRSHRLKRGAIELNLPESKVILDEDDRTRIRNIVQTRSSQNLVRAYNLIEELMLAANEAIGAIGVAKQMPVVYRVHAKPDQEKLAKIAVAAESLGIRFELQKMQNSRGIQKFLKRIRKHDKAAAFNMLMLRAMAQAEYRTENNGHFALASMAYVHFTSPIRRYADLVSHRVIKAFLCSAKDDDLRQSKRFSSVEMEQIAAKSSSRERNIAQAERSIKTLFSAVFMRDRIGEMYSAKISGFGSTGVFVTVQEPFVEGWISFDNLGVARQYVLDDSGFSLCAKRGGHSFSVGDEMEVKLINVSLARRQIEFQWQPTKAQVESLSRTSTSSTGRPRKGAENRLKRTSTKKASKRTPQVSGKATDKLRDKSRAKSKAKKKSKGRQR